MRGLVTVRSAVLAKALLGAVGALAFGGLLSACGATSSASAPAAVADDATPADPATFVAIGGAGRSGAFGNVVTIFSRVSDAQRECLGCRSLRVIYDGVEADGAVGAPRANAVRLDLGEACGVPTATAALPLKALSTELDAASLSAALDLRAHPRCTPAGVVRVELLAKRCLNGGDAECIEPVVREVYETTVGDLLGIVQTESLDLPNRVQR
jgi:hypothetical protein